jgi:hypothetical protein
MTAKIKKTSTKKTAKASEKASKPALEPKDDRLPPAGTVLTKTSRDGKVLTAKVLDGGGVEYAGTTYKTLSGAAKKAAEDLKLGSKSVNGFVFWGLSSPARKVDDPLALLDRTTAKVRGVLAALEAAKLDGDSKAKAVDGLRALALAITTSADAI